MPLIEGFTEATGRRPDAASRGFTPTYISPLEPKDPERTVLGTLGDVGVVALKSAVGLPQAFVGLADIPTGGRVGKALEELGYRPEETQKLLDTWYSDAQQAANEKVRSAEGFLPTIKTALQYPSTIATTAGESLAQMVGGAGVARGILKAAPKLAAWKAAAAGEGILGAGSAAEQIRAETEDGLLTPGQSAAAAASGLGTAVLGAAGGRLAHRLGLGDIDTELAAGVRKSMAGKGLEPNAQRGLLRNVGGSALSEGVFEELPQSAQEQIWQNVALGKPWDQGVGNASAMGLLAGLATGSGGGYINNRAVEADLLRKQEREAAANAQYPKSNLPAGFFDRVNTDNEVGLGIVRPINPYDVAGHVTAFNEGQDTELGSPQAGLFGNADFGAADQSTGLPAAPAAAPPAAAPASAATIFADDEQELIDMGVKPTPAVRTLWAQAKTSGLSENELDTIGSELGKNYGAGKKAFQAILVARNKPAAPAAPAAAAAPSAPDVGTVTPTTATTPTAQATAGAPSLRVVKGAAPVAPTTPATTVEPAAAAAAETPAEPVVPVVTRKRRRVVSPAETAQSQAFVAPEVTEPAGQAEQPAATPQTALALALDDQLEAAQATGNAGELQALAEDDAGLRQDVASVAENDDQAEAALSALLERRFADSKDPKRDAEIARAYLIALRDAPQGSKLKVQEAIGQQFGIKPVAVRKVGNTSALVEAGKTLGYSEQQVLELLQVRSNSKKNNVLPAANAKEAETPDIAGALKQLGVETEEGAAAGFGLDDDRAYTGAAFDSQGRPIYGDTENARTEALHNNIKGLLDKIDALKETASKLAAQGKPEVAAKVAQERERIESALNKLLESQRPNKPAEAPPPSPSATLSPEAKAASDKFRAAKLNLAAMEDSELPALREAAARFKNTELMAQIDRRMGVEPAATQPAAPAETPKKGKAAREADPEERMVLDREKAAAAWDRVADRSDGVIPSFESLSDEQQATFIGFGKDNWKLADISRFAEEEGLINEIAPNDDRSDDTRFGKNTAKVEADNPYTAEELTNEIKQYIRADVLGRKLVVVDNVRVLLNSELPSRRAVGAEIALEGAYGVAADGTAYLVADRIEKGTGRAKFMHEVGAHLGLEGLLPKVVYNDLVRQIQRWEKLDNGSQEAELAKKARQRVKDAGTSKQDQDTELLAYFIEEAVESGIDPTAEALRGSSELRAWFRTLWAAFKSAVRRLGFKPETLSAQDMVNLAFGAARLEIAGTWHGTAAEVKTLDGRKIPFRRFDHRKIGSGEGAQAYGWGSYLAQRFGVGRGYWEADVDRKREGGSVTYNGKTAAQWMDSSPPLSNEVSDEEKTAVAVDLIDARYQNGRGGYASVQSAREDLIREFEQDIKGLKAVLARAKAIGGMALVAQQNATNANLQRQKQNLAALKALDPGQLVHKPGNSPEGSVMRVDTTVKPDELMVWEKPIEQQPAKVREVLSRVAGVTPLTSRSKGVGHLYKRMAEMFAVNDLVENQSGELEWVRRQDPETHVLNDASLMLDGRPTDYVGNPKAASEWLDSMGVKGVTHTDAPSRDANKVLQNYRKQADFAAAFASIPRAVKTNFNFRSALDLAQDVEDFVRDGKDVERIVRNIGLSQEAADAVYEYADWLQDKTGNIIVFNDKNIFRVGARVGAAKQRMRFGKAASKQAIESLPEPLQRPARTVANVLKDTGNKALNVMTFTEDVINRAVDKGLAAAADLRRIYQERAQLTGRLEREVERIAQLYNRVPQEERGTGPRSANQFLYDSTREGKWGFKPDWRKTFTGTVDPAAKARFDALSKESQELVRAIFKHGDEVLALKKKTVLEATSSEYDLLIKAAKSRNDLTGAAKLESDKVDQLKRFGTLFRLKEGSPYAPLKRFGDYVVIARSQAYLDADPKKQAEMEANSTHYHVSFAESASEARALTQQLQEQGAFAEVVMREKEAVQQSMFGGQLTAFNRLRKQLDQELDVATDDEAKAIRAARRVVGELYLTTLAEASARKAELKRKGVAGEIDMLRSFTTQGRADAHFIAGATYNERTLDVFNAMRQQMKQGADQFEKSTIFNELMKRHTQSMEMDTSPLSAKLARATSIYYLALSPGYYITNLTQPWIMSLPVMAGRHNPLRTSGALLKAYTDLAPMFRDVKLLEQFDLSKAPADVRRALTELTNRGRLDIGMDTELGEFKLDGEGVVKDKWNSFDRKLRNFAQRMESINRLATAIAAYRLEIAREGKADDALNYADSIISQTHGDYSATNAPRAFNTSTGKVALQFRKFQLIQLTLLAKLARESFTGKDRVMAAKSLAYLLGTTALSAGAMGLPGLATIAWALKALDFGDDEPFDLEKALREWIGNEALATAVLRGAPAAAGVDLSGKLGMGNALALLPFNEVDLSNRAGYEAALAGLMGPAGGIGARLSDAVSLMKDGQYLRGMEQAMPTGFANVLRSYRTATEGVTRRNGDVLISPEEISGMDSFWQAIGFQPTKISVRQFRDSVKRETDQKFDGQAQRIRNAYLRAKDDPEARAAARERWTKLQDAREAAGYAKQPLSNLMRAEQAQRKRERNTVEGIQFDPRSRRFVDNLVEE